MSDNIEEREPFLKEITNNISIMYKNRLHNNIISLLKVKEVN